MKPTCPGCPYCRPHQVRHRRVTFRQVLRLRLLLILLTI